MGVVARLGVVAGKVPWRGVERAHGVRVVVRPVMAVRAVIYHRLARDPALGQVGGICCRIRRCTADVASKQATPWMMQCDGNLPSKIRLDGCHGSHGCHLPLGLAATEARPPETNPVKSQATSIYFSKDFGSAGTLRWSENGSTPHEAWPKGPCFQNRRCGQTAKEDSDGKSVCGAADLPAPCALPCNPGA